VAAPLGDVEELPTEAVTKLEPGIEAMLAYWMALERLGFRSDQLSLGWFAEGPCVVVMADGRFFAVTCASFFGEQHPASHAALILMWNEAYVVWQGVTADERVAIFTKYVTPKRWLTLVDMLRSSGFAIPTELN
jgi:hypothetical protein